ERGVVVCKRRRAVVETQREISAGPIEYRHEVVAQDRHSRTTHVTDAVAVVVDETVACVAAQFDVLMNRNAFDDRERHVVPLYLVAQLRNAIQWPRLPDGNVEKRSNNSTYGRNLSDVRKRNRVARPEPSEGDHRLDTPEDRDLD